MPGTSLSRPITYVIRTPVFRHARVVPIRATSTVAARIITSGKPVPPNIVSPICRIMSPIGDMIRQIGDTLLGGTGFPLVIILAATVLVALIGTTLACLNTGVRITYVMGRDKEVPGILGMLHFRHATPHYGVIALAIVSAVLGGYAVLSTDNLLQITLASNTGTFLVYGMTNAIVLVAFGGVHKRNIIKHVIVPVAGLVANIAMLAAVVIMSVSAGGSTQTDTLIALAFVGAWIVVGAVWLLVNSAGSKKSLLVKPPVISPQL